MDQFDEMRALLDEAEADTRGGRRTTRVTRTTRTRVDQDRDGYDDHEEDVIAEAWTKITNAIASKTQLFFYLAVGGIVAWIFMSLIVYPYFPAKWGFVRGIIGLLGGVGKFVGFGSLIVMILIRIIGWFTKIPTKFGSTDYDPWKR